MKKNFLTIMMMFLPMLASAEENNVCGDGLTYSFDKSSNTLIISKTGEGTGKMYDYDSNASGQPTWSDHYQTDVHTVIIEDGVTSIGDCAFFSCILLSSVSIPSSVTSIGNKAFYCCFKLTSIEIPENVVSIGSEAFEQCGIASIVIPNSVTSIGSEAFRSCENLTSVSIPNSMTSIEYGLFQLCSGLTSVIIGDGVASIGSQAFYGCSSLTTVMIGNSVTSIGSFVFCNCSNLTDVYCSAEVVPGTKSNAFSGSPIETASLRVPETSIDAYKTTAPWNGFGNILALSGQMSGDNLSMVVEGRKWNVVTINPAYPSEATNGYYDVLGRRGKVWGRYTYVLEGDTVIGGITYKRLLSDGKYVCGLREEDGRVYKRGNNSEGLLYDFNAQPGDIFKNDEYIWMQVGQVRQVSVKGQDRRCLDMYSYYYLGDPEEGEDVKIMGGYNVADYWIEGIGCTGFPDNAFWWFIIGNYPLLVSVYDGDECIFDIEEFASIVATSVRDIPKATDGRSISPDAPIYDLQGRRLTAAPQKGVYIQNGKKKLIK